jgi:cation transporter-like permease
MSYTGATGSIVGSTFTTSYHLGQPMKHLYFNSPLIILFIGSILGLILGITSFFIATTLNFSLPNNFSLISYLFLCLFTSLITTGFAILNSLILGNISFKRGIDADNVIVPLTSTFGDLVTILSFVILLSLFN